MFSIVSMAGEYDKQISGIFDNYPEIPFRDAASLLVPALLSDWLIFYDITHSYLMGHQSFSLMKFFPFVSVAAHLMCAVNRCENFSYTIDVKFRPLWKVGVI